jgi:hypothetical protein
MVSLEILDPRGEGNFFIWLADDDDCLSCVAGAVGLFLFDLFTIASAFCACEAVGFGALARIFFFVVALRTSV